MSPVQYHRCHCFYALPQVFVKPALFAYILGPNNGPETGIITGEGKVHFIIKGSFGLPFAKKLAVVIYPGCYVPAWFINVNKGGILFLDIMKGPRHDLHDSFGIEHGLMTTIHAYTMGQNLLDGLHKVRRRGRAAALSLVPTTTGAAVAVALVIPGLKGKLDGMAIRVPTPNVSVVDLVSRMSREVTAEEVNGALQEAANGRMKGILAFSTEPLVSADFNTSSYSSIVDAALTSVVEGRLLKVLSWYDNEFGYASRLADLAVYMGERP